MGYYKTVNQEMLENYEKEINRKLKEAQTKIPVWRKRGEKVIPKALWEEWSHYLMVNSYHVQFAEEVEIAIKVIGFLAKGGDIEAAKEMIFHNKLSAGRCIHVKSIVGRFSSRGNELYDDNLAEIE